MQSLITIDVEGGEGPDRYESVRRLDGVLEAVGVPTTMFVTPDVVEHETDLVRTWHNDGHTIGLHIHPDRLDGGESDWLTDYDKSAIASFVGQGCSVFEHHLNIQPKVFRAGRWEYSNRLLAALTDHDFERDASMRADRHHERFECYGVTEVPMTVYSNPLVRAALRPWGAERIPLHSDGFLSPAWVVPGFYTVTYRLIHSNREYVMVSLHDYDIVEQPLRGRIKSYLRFIADETVVTTLDRL